MRINVNVKIRLGLDIICLSLFSIKITKTNVRSFRDILPGLMVAEDERLNYGLRIILNIAPLRFR